MSHKSILYFLRICFVTVIFSVGYLCGTLNHHSANADWTTIGQEAVKEAAGSNSALGSVAQLGTAISDMEKNVSGLQQNLDTLKKVKSALGGK
jgi:hypothetical protein